MTISPAAARLRKLRQKQGWSLRELGRRSGVSHPYLSQLETGFVPMGHLSYERATMIADALLVSVEELMEGYDRG